MKEMSPEDKQRIEKEAREYFDKIGRADDGNEMRAWIQGATRENERMAELLKEERIKTIDECIEALSSYRDIDRTQMKEVLEALKGKSQ